MQLRLVTPPSKDQLLSSRNSWADTKALTLVAVGVSVGRQSLCNQQLLTYPQIWTGAIQSIDSRRCHMFTFQQWSLWMSAVVTLNANCGCCYCQDCLLSFVGASVFVCYPHYRQRHKHHPSFILLHTVMCTFKRCNSIRVTLICVCQLLKDIL